VKGARGADHGALRSMLQRQEIADKIGFSQSRTAEITGNMKFHILNKLMYACASFLIHASDVFGRVLCHEVVLVVACSHIRCSGYLLLCLLRPANPVCWATVHTAASRQSAPWSAG